MVTLLKIYLISFFVFSSAFGMDLPPGERKNTGFFAPFANSSVPVKSPKLQDAIQLDMALLDSIRENEKPTTEEPIFAGTTYSSQTLWQSTIGCGGWTKPVNVQAILEHDREVLNLSETNIDDEFFPFICPQNPRLSKVTKLDLRLTGITDKSLYYIAQYFPNLKILKIEGADHYPEPDITNKGLEYISRLRHLCSFSLIQYGFNPNITDEGIRHLTRLRKLSSLSIDFIDCTDLSAFYLRKLPLKKLKIDLPITDRGLNHIAQISSLTKLDISGCDLITGAGFYNHDLKQLLYLEYDDCKNLNLRGKVSIEDLEHIIKLNNGGARL